MNICTETLTTDTQALSRLMTLVREAHIVGLGLSVRVYNMLARNGHTTVEKAISTFRRNPHVCPRFGRKAQEEFRTALEQCGICIDTE